MQYCSKIWNGVKIVKGGVTSPNGFTASSVSCGIKKKNRDDLALLYSNVPCLCAAAFTTNRVKSGSILLSKMRVKKGISQAVIVNSGNANCCVGEREVKDAEGITSLLAERLDLSKDMVLIASTGVIGRALPVDKIKKKVPFLAKGLKKANGTKFAKAIMTTDTVHKELAIEVNIGGRPVRIGGAVKGSGMICPNMATMLAFFTTDAAIEKDALKSAFKDTLSSSFNRITVDGDMSTNDTAVIFANGLSGNKVIKRGTPDYLKFLSGLRFISEGLAKKIVLDGEGATRFIEVSVKGAEREKDAEKIARRVANSNLVKTMIAGGDPNWGRVASSVGASGVDILQKKTDIYFGGKLVMKNGKGMNVPAKKLSDIFRRDEIEISIDLKSGNKASRIWTCDLTEEYVRINAEYMT